jgi:predicted CopG family antitoxin
MTAKEALQFLLNPDVYVKFKNRNAISAVLHNLISKSSKYLRFYMTMGSRTENKLLTDIKSGSNKFKASLIEPLFPDIIFLIPKHVDATM